MTDFGKSLSNRMELYVQLSTLRDLSREYKGKTIDNIIQQIETRLNEVIKQETI